MTENHFGSHFSPFCWGDVVLPRCCRDALSGRAYWGVPPVGPMNPAGPDGPVVAGGPLTHVGRCLRFSMKFWNR